MPVSAPDNLSVSKICLCVGAANVDLLCLLGTPSTIGTSNPANFSQMAGGAALNTAQNLVSLGCKSRLGGLVGKDSEADVVRAALRQAGVANGLIGQAGASTGKYISLLEPDGSLLIAVNDMTIHDDMALHHIEQIASIGIMSDVTSVFCDSNIPSAAIARLAEIAQGKLFSATTVSIAKADRLRPVMSQLSMLFTNRAEAHALLGLEQNRFGSEVLADRLAAAKIPRGVISDGASDIWYWQENGVARFEIPPVSDIVDVVGAGDALAAGVVASQHFGDSFDISIGKGVAAAARVLATKGPCFLGPAR